MSVPNQIIDVAHDVSPQLEKKRRWKISQVGRAQCTFLVAVGDKNIISTVLLLPLKPHCVSGTISGIMWVDSLLRRILAKILPAIERKKIPL